MILHALKSQSPCPCITAEGCLLRGSMICYQMLKAMPSASFELLLGCTRKQLDVPCIVPGLI